MKGKGSTLYIGERVLPKSECAAAHPCVRPYTPPKGVYGLIFSLYGLLAHSQTQPWPYSNLEHLNEPSNSARSQQNKLNID